MMRDGVTAILFVTGALTTLSSSLAAQVAPSTYSAYIGTDAKPSPPAPALGPANSVINDPTFGSPILRVTDPNTNSGESFIAADSGFHRTWNADSTAIKLEGPHGDGWWLEFNPSTFQVGSSPSQPKPHPLNFGARWEWSTVDPDIIYFLNGNQIAKYNKSTGVRTNLGGPSNGDPVTYSVVVIGHDNWVCSVAGPGIQDTWPELYCVNPTSPGTSELINVPQKTIDGIAQGDPHWPTSAPGKTIGIHSISGGTGANWLEVTFHLQSWGANGGAVFNLATNTWSEITKADIYWAGHVSMGNGIYANSSGSQNGSDSRGILLRNPDDAMNSADYLFVGQPAITNNHWCDADHLSWLNSMTNPRAPIFVSRYYSNVANCAVELTGEIYAAAADGSGTIYRLAHNHDGGCYFGEGFAQVSNDGNWVLFSSYWDGTLGPDTSFGCQTRIDTFIIKLTAGSGYGGSPPDFSLTASPASQTVVMGNGTSSTASVSALNGFTGNVALSMSGLPTGAGGTFSPASITGGSGNSTLTITTTTAVAPGTYSLTLTGTSGSLVHTTTVTLVVTSNATDFTVVATPSTETVRAGESAIYILAVTPVNGFTGTVTFSIAKGLAGTFSPSSVTLTGSGPATTMLTKPTSPSSGNSNFNVGIVGTSGTLSHQVNVTLVTSTSADFSIATAPSQQTIVAGNSTTYDVTTTDISGFTGYVNLSISGLPSGATGSFNPALAATPGNSTLTVATTTGVAGGTYTVTITGTASPLSHSTTVTLTIGSSPDFSIFSTPSSQTVIAGNSTAFTTTVTPQNAFADIVNLSLSGLPAGSGGTFSPTSISTSGTSTLTITTGVATAPGTYTVTITGTSGSLMHTSTVSLVVNAATGTDFTTSVTPPTEAVRAGESATYFVTVTPVNGFTGAVTFSIAKGLSGTFSPASVTLTGSGSATAMLTKPTSASSGNSNFNVGIIGTSGSLSHQVNVTMNTSTTADFSIAATPSLQTVSAGGTTTYNVTISGVSGFSGYVNLSVSGLPADATASFNPSLTAPGSSTLTITAGSTTGTFSLTITGTANPLTHSLPVTLTIQ
jgi:uncharacterized membrane protein